MFVKLVQPPMAASHVFPSLSNAMEIMRTHRAFSTTQPWNKKFTRLGEHPFGPKTISLTKVAEQSSELVADEKQTIEAQLNNSSTVAQLKAQLYNALQGINRGIFGVPSAKKAEIEELVKLLESQNPTPEPTQNLEKFGKVAGNWKLVYSTITILGAKRTKLGLRDFITLGDFWQVIDVTEGKAVNVIKFSAKGFSMLNGQLQIDASFKIASKSRVDISYNSSSITPDQLMNVFQKNYDILLSIFNPDGWLEITYVDDSLRIGRDDKGNVFILERSQEKP